MIIGVDTSAIGDKLTGTSKYIDCLLTELRKTDHTIKTFPLNQKENSFGSSLINSIPIIKRGGIRRHLYRKFELASQLKDGHVDCGIFPNYLMPLNFFKPAAIVIHDLSFISNPEFYSKAFTFYYTTQLKKVLKKDPILVTISESSKESIAKYFGINKNKIFLLQGYIDSKKIISNPDLPKSKEEDPYFLFVGHIEPRKNLTFLIENFLLWKLENKNNIRLKIVGEIWSNSKEIRTMINLYGNNPGVDFTGYVSADELQELYLNSAAFVHTSKVEGFGFPVLEAMHYNLPILCSSGSGTEEISKPYSIIVNPFNQIELRRGFDMLLIKSTEKNRQYEIKYSPDLMSNQLDHLLKMLSSQK